MLPCAHAHTPQTISINYSPHVYKKNNINRSKYQTLYNDFKYIFLWYSNLPPLFQFISDCFIHSFIYPSIHLFIQSFISLCIHSSNHPSIYHPFIHPSICLSYPPSIFLYLYLFRVRERSLLQERSDQIHTFTPHKLRALLKGPQWW